MFEAFKADHIDFRRETSLKAWTVAYNFAAAQDGRVAREAFPIERLGIVKAFVFNMRRPKFADPRVRRALALAYGFDGINRNLFHGLLAKACSYFPHTDFEAAGRCRLTSGACWPSFRERRMRGGFDRSPLRAGPTPRAPISTMRSSCCREAGLPAHGRPSARQEGRAALARVRSRGSGPRARGGRPMPARSPRSALPLRCASSTTCSTITGADFRFRHGGPRRVQGQDAPGSESAILDVGEREPARLTNNLAGNRQSAGRRLVERLVLAHRRDPKRSAAGRLLDRALRDLSFGVPIMNEDREFMARWDRFGRPTTMPR